jgi:hypothetical protein
VDYYKLQYRRVSPAPFGWTDIPDSQLGNFLRGHWTGVSNQWETDVLANICGQKAYRTIRRYRLDNPVVVDTVDPINDHILGMWVTAGFSPGTEFPLIMDGVYELRLVGYHYDAVNCALIDPRIMPWCPPEGQAVDPTDHATIYLRVDNRVASVVSGSVHLNTTEPDCDFPDICAVVKNEGTPDEECVAACGIIRVEAGDTLTVHFQASDSDGHLDAFELTGHWAESLVFNLLNPAIGTLAGDPTPLVGPTYAQTFMGAQAMHRAGLLPGDPEHDRPGWFGGHYKVTVTVGEDAFETCCAYLLRLEVWKRTTNGCGSSKYFHANNCEFSFTVFRSDLIDDPDHPSCSDLCPDQNVIP